MRLLTSVFVFLFTFCAFVGTVYAQDEAQTFKIILVRSYVPVCRPGCVCAVDFDTGIIEQSSCAFRTYLLALVPKGLDDDTMVEITTSMVSPTAALVSKAAQEVGADADGCVEAFVQLEIDEQELVHMDGASKTPNFLQHAIGVQVFSIPATDAARETVRAIAVGEPVR